MEIKWWMFLVLGMVISSFFLPDISGNTYYPSDSYEYKNMIEITSSNVEVKFDDRVEKIYVPKEVSVNIEKNVLNIVTPFKQRKSYKIIVGSKKRFNSIKINSNKIVLTGNVNVGKLSLIGSGITLNLNYFGESLILNGAGVNLHGSYICDLLKVDATSFTGDFNVKIKDTFISSFLINANIKYLNLNEESTLSVDSKGFLRVLFPQNFQKNLKILKNKTTIKKIMY